MGRLSIEIEVHSVRIENPSWHFKTAHEKCLTLLVGLWYDANQIPRKERQNE